MGVRKFIWGYECNNATLVVFSTFWEQKGIEIRGDAQWHNIICIIQYNQGACTRRFIDIAKLN